MTQLDVEVGVADETRERTHMEMVHYTMKYLLGDGTTMTEESMDLAVGVMSGVVKEATGVPEVSAMHMMALVLEHRGEHAYSQAYVRMTAAAMERLEHTEYVGVEYQ